MKLDVTYSTGNYIYLLSKGRWQLKKQKQNKNSKTKTDQRYKQVKPDKV